MALQCDLRILAREGKYGVVQVRRGVMPDAYAHFTLPRIVGVSRAASSCSRAARSTRRGRAARPRRRACLPAEVLPTALAIARDIAVHTAPLSVAVTKRLLWESSQLDPAAIERRETALHHHLMARADCRRGRRRLFERRAPQWKLSVSRDWPAGRSSPT
jgi:enoyl-CoA hydratase/carnithine racemase